MGLVDRWWCCGQGTWVCLVVATMNGGGMWYDVEMDGWNGWLYCLRADAGVLRGHVGSLAY